ncbi:MAG: divergent polysaccharide deacetylase family protein [Kiloniellales bacterium]|nr:divergent polysaccharide deacetylase family protein [Kiloniellales bacterium]
MFGAVGLFFSGALIGAVVGTQIARDDFETRLAALERPAAERAAPGMWRRGPSRHDLAVFRPARPAPPAPGSLPKDGGAERDPAQAGFEPEARAEAGEPDEPVSAPPDVATEEPRRLAHVEPTRESPVEISEPAWRRHAVPVGALQGRPAIAIVLDDLGLNLPNTRKAITLPAPLSLAFMTYGYDLPRLTRRAREAGHELLVHLPMEPRDRATDPGPNVLITGMAEADLAQRLDWGLGRFEGFVGVNNHMGSRFTASAPDMALVMQALKRRGLLFLDSQTIADSVGGEVAEAFSVPFARRDVFIDNVAEADDIRTQLAKLERLASRRGYAVGIGHPYSETIRVLEAWIPEAKARGFVFVPISDIVGRRNVSG